VKYNVSHATEGRLTFWVLGSKCKYTLLQEYERKAVDLTTFPGLINKLFISSSGIMYFPTIIVILHIELGKVLGCHVGKIFYRKQ
jgi:hypothetical protein